MQQALERRQKIEECLCKQDNGSLWHIQTERFNGLSRRSEDKGQSPWKMILQRSKAKGGPGPYRTVLERASVNTQTHNTILEFSQSYQAARVVSIQELREAQHKMRPIRNLKYGFCLVGLPGSSVLIFIYFYYVCTCVCVNGCHMCVPVEVRRGRQIL